jgi:hypothetical protein
MIYKDFHTHLTSYKRIEWHVQLLNVKKMQILTCSLRKACLLSFAPYLIKQDVCSSLIQEKNKTKTCWALCGKRVLKQPGKLIHQFCFRLSKCAVSQIIHFFCNKEHYHPTIENESQLKTNTIRTRELVRI